MADRRPIGRGARIAVNGPLADVIQRHRKDPMVHSETLADFIINRLLEDDGFLADLLMRVED